MMNAASIYRALTFGDKVLICGLLFLSLASYPFVKNVTREGSFVQIEVDGKVYNVVSLHTDQTFEVPGPLGNTFVVIQDGEVHVSESPCRAKICVRTGEIFHAGQLIVCVPNKVVVRVIGEEDSPYDAVTR